MKNLFALILSLNLVLMTAFLLKSTPALAHGMDQLGPHKGYIQMPGAFHTELVPNKDGSYKVYLLDIEFKNPMTKNSTVTARLKSANSTESEDLTCEESGEHFVCKSGNLKKVKKGELIVSAKRDGAPGSEAKYILPLKVQH